LNGFVTVELAAIAGLGVICQWLGWRLKLPAIVFLLLAGIVGGPVAGLLRPDELFGELLYPLVSLSVAIILFEGSLTLRISDIRGVERVVVRMITVGTLISWVVATLAAHAMVAAAWDVATLFGAVMVVTGPTVIQPMLRTVRPTAAVSSVLQWEGILIDPIGAVIAILTYEFISALGPAVTLTATVLTLAKMVVAGVAIGASAGHLTGLLLRRHLIPEFLHNFTILGLVVVVFVLADQAGHETGLLAVTVMGVWLANMRDVHVEDILDFKESLSIFLISGLFILLAARLDLALLSTIGWGALGVFAAVQFLARPLKVFVSTLGSRLILRERVLLAWIGPRGIVAAAMSALFGIRLEQVGHAQADLLVPLSFTVIIGTVLLQGATARPLARFLRVAEPEARGFLVVGANRLAREIAKALNRASYGTLLADTSWSDVRAAWQEGLSVYYGNPVSAHADRHVDLAGVGRLLGLSPQGELNSLAIMRY
jgi:NhaP-type Na+/H+ or K+/H+ antiporter